MTALERMRDILFAPKAVCMGCRTVKGADEGWLCAKCYASLQPLEIRKQHKDVLCLQCGEAVIGERCPKCLKKTEKIIALSAYEYITPIDRIIHAFKYSGAYKIGEWMAGEMVRPLKAEAEFTGFVITFVPMHFTRRLARGYNQSEVLARKLSEKTNLPVQGLLERRRYTIKQARLSGEKRRRNLTGAIYAKGEMTGKRVILIDDVRTTGATASECARALRNAGAAEVVVLTFSRALGGRARTKWRTRREKTPRQ
ncbi:MAG: ComF family protein [Clostridia bacterium]|nr:ComF family protein [Clostridia bacterium]